MLKWKINFRAFYRKKDNTFGNTKGSYVHIKANNATEAEELFRKNLHEYEKLHNIKIESIVTDAPIRVL